MPNEAYKNRLEEWEKKERERKAAMEPPSPYDLTKLRSRVPLGCTLTFVMAFILVGYLVYRYFKLQG